MSRNKSILFFTLLALQVLYLCFLFADRLYLLQNGQKIVLKCRPLDPHSLFSGEYVALQFVIGSYTQENFRINDMVFLGLKPGKPFWTGSVLSSSRDGFVRHQQPFLRGRLTSVNPWIIRFGSEDYFVPQYEGKKIEENLADAGAEVAVDPDGRSAISRLFIGGKEITFR